MVSRSCFFFYFPFFSCFQKIQKHKNKHTNLNTHKHIIIIIITARRDDFRKKVTRKTKAKTKKTHGDFEQRHRLVEHLRVGVHHGQPETVFQSRKFPAASLELREHTHDALDIFGVGGFLAQLQQLEVHSTFGRDALNLLVS